MAEGRQNLAFPLEAEAKRRLVPSVSNQLHGYTLLNLSIGTASQVHGRHTSPP
jgi:hypothetical protein